MKRKNRVLVVDDDLDFQAIVRDWLSPHYEYCCLTDGDDLISELDGIDPDALILDVKMPGDDGFTLCRNIRAMDRFARLPVLFLTGCREDEDFIKNIDAGGTAYLTKPVEHKELLSMLRELLSKRGRDDAFSPQLPL